MKPFMTPEEANFIANWLVDDMQANGTQEIHENLLQVLMRYQQQKGAEQNDSTRDRVVPTSRSNIVDNGSAGHSGNG